MWHYLLKAIELLLPLVVILSAVPACLFGVGALLFRSFTLRGDLWRAALAFPAFWVTLEYLNNVTPPHGTFPNMGYTQMDFLPLLQVTSLVGIWGVSFCLFLLPATIAALLSTQGCASERSRLAIAVAVFLAAVAGYGSATAFRMRFGSAPFPAACLDVSRAWWSSASRNAAPGKYSGPSANSQVVTPPCDYGPVRTCSHRV